MQPQNRMNPNWGRAGFIVLVQLCIGWNCLALLSIALVLLQLCCRFAWNWLLGALGVTRGCSGLLGGRSGSSGSLCFAFLSIVQHYHCSSIAIASVVLCWLAYIVQYCFSFSSIVLQLCSCVASVLIHCFSLSVYWLELLGIVENCFGIAIALL